ncbi:MAG: response regulator [Candidatus Omnitrophica bacterium]|nr:response regulator [Candidatus Omnitrophota bacterium]
MLFKEYPIEVIGYSVALLGILFLIVKNTRRQKRTAKSPGRWKSILVIDDDEGILHSTRSILLSAGYGVLVANRGEFGLQIAQTQKPDLIITDVIMPGMKGRELCQRLKQDENTQNIPVVFLTAKDSPEDIAAEKEAGGVAHLTKPVNAKILLATVSQILNAPL